MKTSGEMKLKCVKGNYTADMPLDSHLVYLDQKTCVRNKLLCIKVALPSRSSHVQFSHQSRLKSNDHFTRNFVTKAIYLSTVLNRTIVRHVPPTLSPICLRYTCINVHRMDMVLGGGLCFMVSPCTPCLNFDHLCSYTHFIHLSYFKPLQAFKSQKRLCISSSTTPR